MVGRGLIAGLLLAAGVAHGADPATVCKADKMRRAGLYDACLLKARAKALRAGTMPDVGRCDAKFAAAWAKAEAKGAGACPTNGDATTMAAQVNGDVSGVAAALTPTTSTTTTTIALCGGSSYPACGGTCPSGTSCWATAFLPPSGNCACLPVDATPCEDTGGSDLQRAALRRHLPVGQGVFDPLCGRHDAVVHVRVHSRGLDAVPQRRRADVRRRLPDRDELRRRPARSVRVPLPVEPAHGSGAAQHVAGERAGVAPVLEQHLAVDDHRRVALRRRRRSARCRPGSRAPGASGPARRRAAIDQQQVGPRALADEAAVGEPCTVAGMPVSRHTACSKRERIGHPLGEQARRVVGADERREMRAAVARARHHDRIADAVRTTWRDERAARSSVRRVCHCVWRSSASEQSRKASSGGQPRSAASSPTLRPIQAACGRVAHRLDLESAHGEGDGAPAGASHSSAGGAQRRVAQPAGALGLRLQQRRAPLGHLVEHEGVGEPQVQAGAVGA